LKTFAKGVDQWLFLDTFAIRTKERGLEISIIGYQG